jgi:Fe2+ or Zn2+ uptake regulation protein
MADHPLPRKSQARDKARILLGLAVENLSNYLVPVAPRPASRSSASAQKAALGLDGESAGPLRARAVRWSPAAYEERIRAMLDQVRGRGLKLTPQRMAIVRELAADPTHPTAQELFERLRPSLPTMSFATVYNTLDALASAGLCAALSLSPGPARFDPNMDAHHHAVCDRCGLVRDIPARAPSPAPTTHEGAAGPDELSVHAGSSAAPAGAGIPAVPGFMVRAVEKIYRGLCAECARVAARADRRPRRLI